MSDFFIFAAVFAASAYAAALTHAVIGNTDHGIEWFTVMAYLELLVLFLMLFGVAWKCL